MELFQQKHHRTIAMNPTLPITSAALRLLFIAFGVCAQVGLTAQNECCSPAIDLSVPETSCSEEIFDFEAVAHDCHGNELTVHAFSENLLGGWSRHSGVTSLGMGPDGAIRIYGLAALGLAPSDYFIESTPLNVDFLPSGKIRVTGRVYNEWDSGLAWDVHMILDDALPADEWLDDDSNNSLVLAFGCNADTANWTTYVLDSNYSHLTGAEDFEGSFLQLNHMPVNQHRRYQLGNGGSGHSCGFGLGGWFAWEGIIGELPVMGMSGDLIVDLALAETHIPSCGEPMTLTVASTVDPNCLLGKTEEIWTTWEDETPPLLMIECPQDSIIQGEPTLNIASPDEGELPLIWVEEDCLLGLNEPNLVWSDTLIESPDCESPSVLVRTFQAEVTNGCGLLSEAVCSQNFTFSEVLLIPGIDFPGDTTLACGDEDLEVLPSISDGCGNPLDVVVTEQFGPAIDVIETSYTADFDDCTLDGFVNFGGTSEVDFDGIDGGCGVRLGQFIGMLPNNFYLDVAPTSYGTYSVSARTNSLTADVLLRVFGGPGIIDPALIFSIRPAGSDNPGVNVLGYGLQAATTAPPVMAEEWFDIAVVVAPQGVELWLNGALFWSGPLPENMPESGHFKLAASGSASFDNLAYNAAPSCPNDYTLTRTWMATDATGMPVTDDQFIIVTDVEGPQISTELAVDWPCDLELPAPMAQISDCGEYNLVVTDSLISSGTCSPAGDVWLRTFLAQDVCGNSSVVEQVIQLMDTLAPNLVPIDCTLTDGDTLYACPEDPEWALAVECTFEAIDNCSPAVDVIETNSSQSSIAAGAFTNPAPGLVGTSCEGGLSHSLQLAGQISAPGGEFFSVENGVITPWSGGGAHLSGEFWNQELGPDVGGLTLNAYFAPGLTWTELGTIDGNSGFTSPCINVADLHELWMYHLLDSAELIGFGVYEGLNLNLEQALENDLPGLQSGWGANSMNAENGFRSDFSFNGFWADQPTTGSGHLIGDLLSQSDFFWTRTLTAMDCAGNEASLTYTLAALENCDQTPPPVAPAILETPTADFTATSEIIERKAFNRAHLSLSPNPSEGVTQLTIQGFSPESDLEIQVFNSWGGLATPQVSVQTDAAGNSTLTLSALNLLHGPYHVECFSDSMKAGITWFICD